VTPSSKREIVVRCRLLVPDARGKRERLSKGVSSFAGERQSHATLSPSIYETTLPFLHTSLTHTRFHPNHTLLLVVVRFLSFLALPLFSLFPLISTVSTHKVARTFEPATALSPLAACSIRSTRSFQDLQAVQIGAANPSTAPTPRQGAERVDRWN